MSIATWPENERPREKLLQRGTAALSDAELLAIFLRVGRQGKTAVDIARELLNYFKGLRPMLSASVNEFCEFPGVGPVKYTQLQAALELGQRYLREDMDQKPIFNNPQATKQFLNAKLRDKNQEIFACLFLDNRHQVICYEELFHGTVNHATVYPREIVKQALAYNASALIIAHNHPSGDPQPSESDKQLTTELKKALKLVDISLLDHFVVGSTKLYSFVEHGIM